MCYIDGMASKCEDDRTVHYTPGPWIIHPTPIYLREWMETAHILHVHKELKDGSLGGLIARVEYPLRDPECLLNAHLIAMSPELLEMCKSAETSLRGMAKVVETYGFDHDAEIMLEKADRLHTAIVKVGASTFV